MRIASIIFAASLFLASPTSGLGQQWAEGMFKVKSHNFGSVARDAKAEFEFNLTNPFLEDVEIASVTSSCGCTSVTVEKRVLRTYESGSIVAKFNTDRFQGKRGATITVKFSQPQRASVRLRVDGYIHNDLIVEPSSADLGTVDKGTPAERTVSVRYAGRYDLKIVGVKTANPHLKAKIVPSSGVERASYDLLVQLDADAPPGYIRDNLLLVTTHQQLKQIPVMVEARVMPEITVTPSTLFLGVLRPGESVTKNIVVRAKRPFTIKSIKADHEGLTCPTVSEGTARPIYVLPVTITAGKSAGALVHRLVIETDISSETPQLSSYAVVRP